MKYIINKWADIVILIICTILVFSFIPFPTYNVSENRLEAPILLGINSWTFSVIKEDQYNGKTYLTSRLSNYAFVIETLGDSTAKLERSITIPERSSTFSFMSHGPLPAESVKLRDSRNVNHDLNLVKRTNRGSSGFINEYDISQYSGQYVQLSIYQSSGTIICYYNYQINRKKYTIVDNFILYLKIIRNITLYSLIIGLIIGLLELSFFINFSNKSHKWVRENHGFFSTEDKWYIKYYLKNVFYIANAGLNIADKFQNVKIRTWIKTSVLIGWIIIVIYTTGIFVYVATIVVIALLILALIISLLTGGGSPSGGYIGGGGSSSGSGGGSSSSSSGAIFGSSYEETAKEESRPFKVDKETRSSEGALPFGLGGDTIYKTEYEETSTGDTVKGYGWTRSEADFNARKNLKKK